MAVLVWQVHGSGPLHESRAESLLLFVAFISSLILGLFVIVLYRLYLSVSLPVIGLTQGIRRYWSGDFSTRVPITARNELGYLQQSFNEMAEKIERMLLELKQLDELKSEFVSTVSHELRTPLTSIGGYVKLIVNEEAGSINETQREFLQIVDRNVDRLSRLIDDLLDSERLERGRFEVQKERLRLAPILSECVNTVAVIASKKGLSIRLHVDRDDVEILAERPRLFQIFMNLLHNAVKYTERGGIEVALSTSDFSAIVRVADTGIGLSEEERGRIFDRFYRSRSGLSNSEGGTGLGLAIARGLIESFGGQITVESELGKGTVFSVSLPLAPRDGKDAGLGRELQEPRTVARPIWIVDGDSRTREELAEMLEAPRGALEGWRLRSKSFPSVREIPPVTDRTSAPAVVFLGVDRKSNPDLELAQELQRKVGGRVPLVLLGEGEMTSAWKALGALGWVGRPIRTAEVFSALYEGLARKQARVLIADPDTDLRLLLRRALEQTGLRVEDFGSAREVLERIEQSTFDLVLLDEALSDLPVREAVQLIHQTRGQQRLPVAYLSHDEVSEAHQKELKREGFSSAFSKAKGLPELVEAIRRSLT